MTVYWYGLFIVSGILAGTVVAVKLAKRIGVAKEAVIDLVFWLVVWGTIGARLYHALIEIEYYLLDPLAVLMVWQGGLAIHGALIAGLLVLWRFAKKQGLGFWPLAALLMPGLALGQAIGRWGNWFNQELFGGPTGLPWGIPIALDKRPPDFLNDQFFHPAFLYESLGSLIVFSFLMALVRKKSRDKTIVLAYFALYSLLRFTTEFIRIDETAQIAGFRLPQILSALVFIASLAWLYLDKRPKKPAQAALENNTGL